VNINVTGGLRYQVSRIEAVLSGVATQLDFSSSAGTLSGNASISIEFNSSNRYEVKGFLLGFTGQQPHLKGKLIYRENLQLPDLAFDFDLTELLNGFNSSYNKKNPLTITAGQIETSASPIVDSTIDPWDEKNHTIDH
jgi:hypothetical protein